jgi:Regulator of ribonuclease activity B
MTMFELLTETAKADRDLLLQRNEAGDDFNKPREVDFAFETRERDRADDFAEFVIGKSYGAAKVNEIEPSHFQILVLITMPINQNIINSVSGFMLCLSRLFKIDYQGWGSVIQNS